MEDYETTFDSGLQCSPERREWYERLSKRLGCSIEDMILHHCDMFSTRYVDFRYRELFPNESPENKRILWGILESVVDGEDFPHF